MPNPNRGLSLGHGAGLASSNARGHPPRVSAPHRSGHQRLFDQREGRHIGQPLNVPDRAGPEEGGAGIIGRFCALLRAALQPNHWPVKEPGYCCEDFKLQVERDRPRTDCSRLPDAGSVIWLFGDDFSVAAG